MTASAQDDHPNCRDPINKQEPRRNEQKEQASIIAIEDEDTEKNKVHKHNVPQWLAENEKFFQPPICNKLMYGEQLKVMFVGGPNVRKDFHIDCGEEFFYQIKGNIRLPIYQRGERKIMHINEGQVFLLRGRIPHSPQRPEKGSVGLVIERDRMRSEIDALRYYVCDFDESEEDANRILWEKWFYCSDLGTQLPPVVQQFKASEQFTSHIPSETSVSSNPPTILDTETELREPFDLIPFIEKNGDILRKHKQLDIFNGTQTLVRVMCGPSELRKRYHQQTWVYVLPFALSEPDCKRKDINCNNNNNSDNGVEEQAAEVEVEEEKENDEENANEDQPEIAAGICQLSFDYPCERTSETLRVGDCVIVNKDEQFRLQISSSQTLVMLVSMDTAFPEPDLMAIPGKYDRHFKKLDPWEILKDRDPHYQERMRDRGATEQEIDSIDADITLDAQ
jgi:3-hydroxyanthranilate 3,4-dioxygenase